MSEIYFSNYRLKKDTFYFLYIGSIRNYGLNLYLKEALSRIYNRPFDFISIVQDVFARYSYPNIMVVNPLVKDFSRTHGGNGSCRLITKDFMSCVSADPDVLQLVQQLLKRQKKLYIYMYQSMPEMTLNHWPGVVIIGPDSKISDRVNSKIFQYRSLERIFPLPDYRICMGLDALIKTTDPLWPKWTDGIFVSEEYSAGGLKSMVARNADDILKRFTDTQQNYLISRYIPHEDDPTVLGVVANEKDIYIAGVADQFIEQGTRFVGSVFPSIQTKTIMTQLEQYTRRAGQWLAREGFRGMFGCDYLVDLKERIYFLEVNARKQGTATEFCCTLENTLPKGSAMLPELEYYAVFQEKFPERSIEMHDNAKKIHWGTHNYKTHGMILTVSTILGHRSERDAFRRLGDDRVKQEVLILDHIGPNFIVAEKSFLARIIALGKDRASVLKGLEQGKRNVESTICFH
jgi:ATP-grasp domain